MEPGGSVVNFSSVAGSNAVPGGIHYCASKHAVSSFLHDLLGLEFSTVISPMFRNGPYKTNLNSWANRAITIIALQVIGLTRTAAKEMGSKKIRVNAVAP